MINQIAALEANSRILGVAIKAANHLGHIPTDQPDYNPLLDPDVLQFIEDAIFDRIQAESQQAHLLDVLDREV